MKTTRLYLMGHINGSLGEVEVNPTFTWRKNIRDYFEGKENVIIDDPTFTNFDTEFSQLS